MKKTTHTCKHCFREYKEKFNYDRHIGFCEFSHKTIRERDHEIESFEKPPSINELFSFVKELVIRIDKLEKENEHLKKITAISKKKLGFGDWLNFHNKPSITFTKWLSEIPYHLYLNDVFNQDLISGTVASLQHKNSDVGYPIYAFVEKQNGFYIYDEMTDDESETKLKWIWIQGSDFDKWLNYISQSFLIEFKKWCDEHKKDIDTNEVMKEKYYSNFQKVLGNSKLSVDVRNQRIRQQLFHKIKQSFGNGNGGDG
jgi:hypothetical protein